MKNDLPFDDFVKKQFSDYSPDVPAHIWENIAAAKRRKPKGFWITLFSGSNLLLLSAIIIIGGGTSYFFFQKKNNSSSKNVIAQQNILSSKKVNAPVDDSKQDNSSVINDQSNESKYTPVEKEKNVTDVISDNGDVDPGNSSNQNNFFKNSSKKKTIKYTDDNNNNGEEIKAKEIFTSDATNKEGINNSYTAFSSPFKFNNARELSEAKNINSLNIKLPDCPAIEKNAAGNKKYWEVYVGPDHAFDSYKSYGDTASTNYLAKRKASTKFASAFSAGVRYTKVFNNGTSVRAGVNYTQVNEKFLYFNPSEIKYVTVITTRVVVRAPGDTLYFADTLQYQQTGTRTKTTYNRYRNIDVPLLVGYEFGNGKIHANLNAGVVINIYSWYKGDVLDSLYQPVTITTGKNNTVYQFKNNIGVGFMGSLSVYYKITDRLHLVLEPYFRYNLSPMSKENLNLQQKYHIAGLHAGVRFDLK